MLLPSQLSDADRISTRSTHREARRDATVEHRTAREGSDTTPLGTEQLGQSQVPRSNLNVKGVTWTDWNAKTRNWRAVDVERAFFALGR